MKGGITLVLVLFASITIGDVDSIQCYECAEKSQDGRYKTCNGDDLGELMDCPGYCEKQTTLKTGGFFLTMNSELACLALSFN